jgi:predicted transcriptional regulator of viral defense system
LPLIALYYEKWILGVDLMKYYEKLVDLGCFSLNDAQSLTGNRRTAQSILDSYKKKGLIECVRRDLYVAISLETKQPVPNRYAIASRAAPGAYVCYHSAFEYHGLANQVYYEVYAAAESRFREFTHNGVTYRHVPSPSENGIETKVDGVRVTDLERTVVDGINDYEKSGGLEELLRCIGMIPFLNPVKLLGYLRGFNKTILYQKAGYILEQYRDAMKLPDSFFDELRSVAPQSKRYLYSGLQREPHILSKSWAMYVPEDFLSLTRKGEFFDV